jgi:hypothetical protein
VANASARAEVGSAHTAVFIKALYSLVIALVVAASAALTAATGSVGFLFAFGLQTLFFWALFVYRKQITARLVAATTGAAHHEGLPRAPGKRAQRWRGRAFARRRGHALERRGARDHDAAARTIERFPPRRLGTQRRTAQANPWACRGRSTRSSRREIRCTPRTGPCPAAGLARVGNRGGRCEG